MDEHDCCPSEIAPRKSSRRRNRKSREIRNKRQRLLTIDPYCKYCRIPLDLENSTLDHIIPLSKGGTNKMENLAVACSDCNNKKGNAIDYVAE